MTLPFRSLAILGAASALVALSACSGTAQPAETGADGSVPLSVAVAFYPFQFVSERVGGDLVKVENLTSPGAEPHDLELAPRQVALLSSADLLVYQTGFQPAVDQALTQAQPKRAVDTASFLQFMPATEGEDAHADEGDSHADEGDSHGGLDPHVWLDPTNMVTITEHVRDALIEARPAAKDTFTDNAAALVGELKKLDSDFSSGLAGCQIKPFVTSHAAFGYLAHRYGLEQVAIRGLEPDTEPTAVRIAEVQALVKANGVTTIFFETLVSPVVSESIATDLGLKTDVLDPLEGITADSRGNDYLEVMRSNLASLEGANKCS